MVSKFGILSQVVNSMWVGLPQVTMLWACLNMTLDGELDIKPKL